MSDMFLTIGGGPMALSRHYVFGKFRLNAEQRSLFRGKELIALQPKVLETLLFLVERHGCVVDKKELMDAVWPGAFVEEGSVARNVSVLRKVLSPNQEGESFIETIPKRGYRFAAPVSQTKSQDPDDGTRPGSALAPPTSEARRKWLLWIAALILFGGLAGTVFALNVFRARERIAGNTRVARIQSLAVLPLTNLSGDPAQEYFSDGMTDALITDLAQMGSLKVISRTSVMRFKGTQMPLGQVARELHVDGVVEGSVVRSGTRVRITAQLLDAAADRHIWAKSYERDLGDILIVQSEISRAIASEINVQLTPQESARLATAPQANPDAYQAYLLGRFHWNRGDKENLMRSIDYYEQALAKDPGNALAYAGIADSYSYLSDWYQRPREAMPKAKAAAVKALELNESLAAAHNSLCYIQQSYDWDWDGAEKECRRAIQLNPSFADAHDNYATLLAYVGRFKESAEELKRAEELDPLSFHIYTDGELSFFLSRDYARAEEQAKRAIELEPDYFLAHSYLGLVYAEMGRAKEAVAEAEKAASLTDSPLIEGFMGYTYAASGKKEAARKIAKDLVKKRASEYVCAFEIGTIHLRLGEREQAFPWFEKAFDEKSLCITSIKFDPRLDPVRDDPRLKILVERAGFPKD
jgi:TolB-like protein/DNA-binding winged helix-turn-helix (wHTH) protein/Flp pilus assembly protein TadD